MDGNAEKCQADIEGKRSNHELIRSSLEMFCSSADSDSGHCSFEMHEILVKSGKAVDEIINTVEEKGCDMIVIGAHRGLFGATAVGSTAGGVLHHAKVPVLVVPPPEVG